VINAGPVRECVACGTIIPAGTEQSSAASVHEAMSVGSPDLADHANQAGWRRLRGAAHLFVGCVLVLLAGIVAGRLGAQELQVDLALTTLFAVVACVALVLDWKNFSPVLFKSGGLKGLLAAVVGLVAIAGFARLYFPAVRWFGFPFVRYTDLYMEAGFPIWSAYLLVSLAPAVSEELVFRGYISQRLSELLSPSETIVVQAALFALAHLSPVIFPSHFFMGIVFGLVRRKSGSLYPGMFVHAAWNAYAVYSEVGW
jgi:membrane protease YdiL (CAAX protease family)